MSGGRGRVPLDKETPGHSAQAKCGVRSERKHFVPDISIVKDLLDLGRGFVTILGWIFARLA